jgi:di/tricarboxylate transporter
MMVTEPGGYQFTEFAKVGIPVTVFAGAIPIILKPIVYLF